MKRSNIILLISIVLLSLFNSCQKEENKSMNLKLIAYEPENIGGQQWLFQGRVISSGKVDLSEHGFEIAVGGNVQRYPLGALSKVGEIEFVLDVPGGMTVSDAVLYAYDKNGNIYSSKETTYASSAPVMVSAPVHSSDFNNEYFSGVINNLNTAEYTVMEYGLEYRETSSSTWTKYAFAVNPDTNPSIPVNGAISTSTSTFSAVTNYSIRFYVIVHRNSDSTTTTVYSGESAFTSIAT
jgi:hypothetical protein